MNLKEYKRELVISRLKKTAANLWGYQESETEGFDPVVDLLLGTCATEFEKLSTDIHISQSRILEKVAQTILPEVSLKPHPSHAILNAKPVKAEHFLKNDDQFVFDKEYIGESPAKIENKKLYFSPALSMKLIDAEPVVLATSHEIFKYSNGTVKVSIARNSTYKIPVNNSIWIALKIDINIKSLKNISFYFNWPDNPDRDKLIKLLSFSQWSVDNRRINIKSGFSETIHREYRDLKTDIFSFIDINRRIEKKILNLYQESFITINEDIMPSKQNFPQEFKSFYSEDILDQMNEEYAWVRIDFPELFPVNHLASTFCMLNAFPVINRRLHNSNRPITLSENLDIIPLFTDDYFLSIRNIISSNQISYQEVPFCKAGDFPPGTYTIRTEGIKRFDTRDIHDFIKYLIELSREEHAVFKSTGSSLIDKELKDLLVILNRLRMNVSQMSDLQSNTHFIVIKSKKVEDVWIEFWSTNGEFGNNLPAGSSCFHSDFDKKSMRLLNATSGGKNPPEKIDRTHLFKKELLTKDRIVTREDIRLSCFAEYGDELVDVEVYPKPVAGYDRKKGIYKTLNIKLNFMHKKDDEEKKNIIANMKDILIQSSSCLYEYQVECN